MTQSIPKKMLAAFVAALLACTMGALALVPQSAHAAQAADMSLTTNATSSYRARIEVDESRVTPKGTLGTGGMSVSIASTDPGEAVLIWELRPLRYHPEFSDKTLTVRYYYGSNAKQAKTKTVTFHDDRGGMLKLKNLQGGKTLKIQMRLNGKLDGKAQHSAWTPLRSIKVVGSDVKPMYLRSTNGSWNYTYNKNGLITKIAHVKDDEGGISHYELKYNGTKLTKVLYVNSDGSTYATYTLKYDSKNRVKKIVVSSKKTDSDMYNHTSVFSYNKKNQITKVTTHYKLSDARATAKYAYDAKGRVKKVTSPGVLETLKYDSKGSLTNWTKKYTVTGGSHFTKYKNKYKSGRLAGYTKSGSSYSLDYTVKYAKKLVPTKYANAVAKQQLALRQPVPGTVNSVIFETTY